MKIEREATYFESYLPPRCRKVRHREVTGTVSYDIPEVTSADAPVAIIQTRPGRNLFPVHRDRGLWNRLEYRFYNGRFYTTICRAESCCYNDYKRVGRQRATAERDIHWSYIGAIVAGLDSRQEHFAEAMSRYLIIDGVLHAEIGEPRYVVMTRGLGCNHGGTALLVDHWFNPNIVTEAYFSVLEEAEARDAALSVAIGRGDTKDVPHIRRRRYDHFEVLIPEAVTMTRESRTGPVDEFSATANAITNSGMPPVAAGLALFAAVFR